MFPWGNRWDLPGLGHIPAGTDTKFQSLGMSLGLLTTLVCNLGLLAGSQFNFGVGGAVIPMIALMTDFFYALGPDEPHTIMVALPLITVICGALLAC